MKKYVACDNSYYFSGFNEFSITRIEIKKETPKNVTYKGDLIPKIELGKFDRYHGVFDTFEDAKTSD